MENIEILQPFGLIIKTELDGLLPPLSEEEVGRLENSIITEGIREPLKIAVIDGERVIVDGHNRYRLAQKHQKYYNTETLVNVTTIDDAKMWIIENQIGRRNLNQREKMWFIVQHYNLLKSQGSTFHGNRYTASQGWNPTLTNTRDFICEMYGVPQGTFTMYRSLFNKIAYLEERRILTGANVFITRRAYLAYEISATTIEYEYDLKISQKVRAEYEIEELASDAPAIEQLKTEIKNASIKNARTAEVIENDYVAAKAEQRDSTELANASPLVAALTTEDRDLLDNPYGLSGLTIPKQEEIQKRVIKAAFDSDPDIKAKYKAEYDEVFARLQKLRKEREEILAPVKEPLEQNRMARQRCEWRLEELAKLLKI